MTADQLRELTEFVTERVRARLPADLWARTKVEDRSRRGYLFLRFVIMSGTLTTVLFHARTSVRTVTIPGVPKTREDRFIVDHRVGDVRVLTEERGTLNRRPLRGAIDRSLDARLPEAIGKIAWDDLVDRFDLTGKIRISRSIRGGLSINADVSEEELGRFIEAIPAIFGKDEKAPTRAPRTTAWERLGLDDEVL